MAKEVKILALANRQILISEIEEVGSADIGEPDCKLINPFVINTETGQTVLEPFLTSVTRDTTFMMGSDKILTLAEPTPTILEKYLDLLK
tara:strand:+ start:466 stop:735 length:270 start_codon:yes stop_codon:yes gene_type:complete